MKEREQQQYPVDITGLIENLRLQVSRDLEVQRFRIYADQFGFRVQTTQDNKEWSDLTRGDNLIEVLVEANCKMGRMSG